MLPVKAAHVYYAFYFVECGKFWLTAIFVTVTDDVFEGKGACHDYKYALTYLKVATGDINCQG